MLLLSAVTKWCDSMVLLPTFDDKEMLCSCYPVATFQRSFADFFRNWILGLCSSAARRNNSQNSVPEKDNRQWLCVKKKIYIILTTCWLFSPMYRCNWQIFGAKMAKSVVLARTSLADMRRHRKQVIIVFNDADLDDLANHIFAGLIWSDQLLDGTPATSRSVSELVSHLDATYRYLFNLPTKYSSPFSQTFPHLLSTYFPTCFNRFPTFPQPLLNFFYC